MVRLRMVMLVPSFLFLTASEVGKKNIASKNKELQETPVCFVILRKYR